MGIALIQLPLLPGVQLEQASSENDVILLVAITGHVTQTELFKYLNTNRKASSFRQALCVGGGVLLTH